MGKTILIVDDDPAQRRLLQAAVERNGFLTRAAENGAQAVEAVEKHADIDIVLLDLVMPGMTGQEALKEIRQRRGDLPAIVLTASGGIDTVVQAMQAGASDFFVKPASPERIMVSIRNALEMSNLKTEVVRMKKRVAGQMSFDDMVANAPVMAPVVRMGKRAAASNIPVLITGESGVGKELLARAIQGASERAGRPFVTVNCGAIPENLLEAEFFGYRKGAFTGAQEDREGFFQAADGGTLFLDEIGDMPLSLQAKLLRVLQEGAVRPVGATQSVNVDVRIISATHRNLDQMRADRTFREDLFYRLNVVALKLPSLSERREDIPLLVSHFLKKIATRYRKAVPTLAPDALAALVAAPWPGNVRQLENLLEQAVALSTTHVIPLSLIRHSLDDSAAPLVSFEAARKTFERDYLVRILKLTAGNAAQAAQMAGRNRTEFYKLLQRHNLEPGMFKS